MKPSNQTDKSHYELSGRIEDGPSSLLKEEVLNPQFQYEVDNLLPHYVAMERAFLAEYRRMGILTDEQAFDIDQQLDAVTLRTMLDGSESAMSDVAFTLERLVESRLSQPVPTWHVDRSRNDLQACAQLLFARSRLLDSVEQLLTFGRTAMRLAERHLSDPMPGYTHLQAAQVISPGFYFASLTEQVLGRVRRLLQTFDGIDACPLGAGAMSGQELAWDRENLARQLGFARVEPLALASVAGRDWALEITSEFSILGVILSRFVTDLMAWGSSAYGFLDLPDELSGISSAMPQKKNFPILERIRGKTAHLSTFHTDTVFGQRNTSYSNSVEVSKEAGALVFRSFDTCVSMLRIFTAVLDNLSLDTDRMESLCRDEFLGGFALANYLTLKESIPWRKAQVIAGRYIVLAMEKGLSPTETDPDLLRQASLVNGYEVTDADSALEGIFDPQQALRTPQSSGSTSPESVESIVRAQAVEFERLSRECAQRASVVRGRP